MLASREVGRTGEVRSDITPHERRAGVSYSPSVSSDRKGSRSQKIYGKYGD